MFSSQNVGYYIVYSYIHSLYCSPSSVPISTPPMVQGKGQNFEDNMAEAISLPKSATDLANDKLVLGNEKLAIHLVKVLICLT